MEVLPGGGQVCLVCWPPYGKPHNVQALVRIVQEQLRGAFCFKSRSDTIQCIVYTSLFGAKSSPFIFVSDCGNFAPKSDGGWTAIDEANKQTSKHLKRRFSAGYDFQSSGEVWRFHLRIPQMLRPFGIWQSSDGREKFESKLH